MTDIDTERVARRNTCGYRLQSRVLDVDRAWCPVLQSDLRWFEPAWTREGEVVAAEHPDAFAACDVSWPVSDSWSRRTQGIDRETWLSSLLVEATR